MHWSYYVWFWLTEFSRVAHWFVWYFFVWLLIFPDPCKWKIRWTFCSRQFFVKCHGSGNLWIQAFKKKFCFRLHTHTHACTHARTHARTHTHARTRTPTHARTHARTHAHTHTHTHTRDFDPITLWFFHLLPERKTIKKKKYGTKSEQQTLKLNYPYLEAITEIKTLLPCICIKTFTVNLLTWKQGFNRIPRNQAFTCSLSF